MPQNDGWNVVSTAPAPKVAGASAESANDGWNVVSTSPVPATPKAELATNTFNPFHPLDNIKSNWQSLKDVGAGILKSIPGTIAGVDKLTGNSMLLPVGQVAHNAQQASQQNNQALQQLAQTHNAPQAAGKVIGNAAQFLAPGPAEEAAAGKLATLAPRAATAARIGVKALGAGTVNKAQGGSFGAGAAAGGIGEGIAQGLQAIPKILTAGVDETIPGTSVTPRQRYDAAQRLGVQLDAADATNSPALRMLKKVNEHSLLGGGTYEKAKAANTAALQGSTDDFLKSMYDGDREGGGAVIQAALKNDHQGLKQAANTGFQALTDQTKGQPMLGAPAVGQKAQTLLDTIAPLAQKYPSLAPAKTMNVLSDLSNVGRTPEVPVRMSGLVDESGAPIPSARQPKAPAPDTFTDLQRLRSATHDLTTANPDFVKSQSIAPLQQMTGTIDDAMTNAANGLNPEQTKVFRDANSKWSEMKSTYDDPSNPLYHALRTDTPSTLYNGNGLGPKTPEAARDLLPRLGQTADNLQPAAVGALRRGTVESALKTTSDGSPNFKTFGTQLNRIPADYRAELFSLPQNQRLQDLNQVSNLLAQDSNPSGSAKQLQKFGEVTGIGSSATAAALGHPLPLLGDALYNAAQYGGSKLMNNPAVVERLMSLPNAPLKITLPGRLPMMLPLSGRQDSGQ